MTCDPIQCKCIQSNPSSMHHAVASLIPQEITSKPEFWANIRGQLEPLLEGQKDWVTNLANVSSVLYHALQDFKPCFGKDRRAVNWCGFYFISSLSPEPRFVGTPSKVRGTAGTDETTLLLGPFYGKPACQFINVSTTRGRGICADAFLQQKTVVVPNVYEYPDHIACDEDTRSEIVCPLILENGNDRVVLGVLDLDCVALGGFDEQDRVGLEAITDLIVKSCNW